MIARSSDNQLKEICLTSEEFCNYLGENVGHGGHLSDLRAYDHPRELREFYAVPNEVEVKRSRAKPAGHPPAELALCGGRHMSYNTCSRPKSTEMDTYVPAGTSQGRKYKLGTFGRLLRNQLVWNGRTARTTGFAWM